MTRSKLHQQDIGFIVKKNLKNKLLLKDMKEKNKSVIDG